MSFSDHFMMVWRTQIPAGGSWEIHSIGEIAETLYSGNNTSNRVAQVLLDQSQLAVLAKYGTVRLCVYDREGNVYDRNLVYFQEELGTANKFIVTFQMQGYGTQIAPVIIKNGEQLTKPEELVENGYTFAGWYREKDCVTRF